MSSKTLSVLLVTPAWRGSLGFFCRRALEQMGHRVSVFDYRRQALGEGYASRGPAGLVRIMRNKVGVALMNRRLRQAVDRLGPDLVLVIKGELIQPSTVEALSQGSGAAVALWYPDVSLYLTKRSYRRIAQSMAHYHATFLCDLANLPKTLGPTIRRKEFLTFACDPEFHHQVPLTGEERARYGSRICFVGNSHGRGSPRDSTLAALSNYPLAVWGNGWERVPWPQEGALILRGPAHAEHMLKVYSSSEIALNFSFARYLNFRNFEVPACGPLLVTEDVPELARFFRPGEEVVAFQDVSDLRQKLDYYLAHPDQAQAIARRGRRRAHAEHTFVHRMTELLNRVFS